MAAASINPVLLPQEIIVEILLRVPPKSLLKCKCVSKSWLLLISNPDFVNTHLELAAMDKENRLHKVICRVAYSNFKVGCLPSLFCNTTELVFNLEMPPISGWFVDSVNGLICLFKVMEQGFIWNPTIGKFKKLPRYEIITQFVQSCSYYCKWGFGYDKLHDDYKVVVIKCFRYDDGLYDNLVHTYSLRTDSWRTVRKFRGYFLNHLTGKFVNGKLYWASCTTSAGIDGFHPRYVVSFDLEDETWGKLELPNYGEDKSPSILGAVGNDLCMICTCILQGSTCDGWIMKDSGVDISWSKMFSINYPHDLWGKMLDLGEKMRYLLTYPRRFYLSNNGEILLLNPQIAMIYNLKDGSSRQLEVNGYVDWRGVEIYVESLVDPLLIAARGEHNHETSLSVS